jgi:arylsulfatase A-like enzyme
VTDISRADIANTPHRSFSGLRYPRVLLVLLALLVLLGTQWMGGVLPLGECRAEQADTAGVVRPPTVILVSLDGTRPADVTEADLPSVAAFRHLGASARSMVTVNPSNTFPSHVTLVTGVAPERHGLVNNAFVDPERGLFAKKDIPSWIEVEPIWSWLAERGIVSASYYWVGSEGPWPPSGRGPLYWKPFSSKTREQKKVDQMLAWLDIDDEATRPRLITSWFHGADHAGHHAGAGSEAAHASLREQDEAIAHLIAGLEARDAFAHTTLIFVSDHGMVGAERTVNLGGLYKQAGLRARVLGIGGFASVTLARALEGEERAAQLARAVEIARGQGLEAHPRDTAPAGWRVANDRFGDVVVRAPVGTAISYGGLELDGFHGYDPEEPSMRAILFARGRGARPGGDLGVVRSIDVAPTVLYLLGQTPPDWMEGRVIEGLRVGDVPAQAAWGRLGRPAPAARTSEYPMQSTRNAMTERGTQ